ncbi:MAG: hypothetical protein ACLR8P_16780 [Clostridium fessum]
MSGARLPWMARHSNVGAVVGATYPEMSAILRKLMPKNLLPGTGLRRTGRGTAKGLRYCFNEDGLGASRQLLPRHHRGIHARTQYAPSSVAEHFADASRQAVIDMVADIGQRAVIEAKERSHGT